MLVMAGGCCTIALPQGGVVRTVREVLTLGIVTASVWAVGGDGPALGQGVPALAAHRSAPAEILGEAGMLVDTLDEQAMADGLQRMLEDEQWAQQARTAGLQRAGHFTWQACAAGTAEVYRQQWQRFF